MNGIERDDVRVLKPRQRKMFVAGRRPQLEYHQTIAEAGLRGKIHPRVRSAPEFRHEVELTQWTAQRRKLNCPRSQSPLAFDQSPDLGRPMRKPFMEPGDGNRLTIFISQSKFFRDQFEGGFRILLQSGALFQEAFGERPFALSPALDHLFGQSFHD
jgi:hypothetical protein